MHIDNEFVAAIRRDMVRFAQLHLRDAALAEDAVQEALAAALSGQGDYSGRSALKTWVFSILRHKIVDLVREAGRVTNFSALDDDEAALDVSLDRLFKANGHWCAAGRPTAWRGPEESLQEREFWDTFEVCLNHLPENTARVFMMREFLEFETAEICSSLQITVSNCNVILHRARAGLRRCLEAGWFGAGDRP